MFAQRRATGRIVRSLTAVLLVSATLAGCANGKMTTGSVRRMSNQPLETMSEGQIADLANRLGERYARKPGDMETALAYADVLRMTGRDDQALAVMRKLAIAEPKNRRVLAAYGKALAANGEFEAALDAVHRAQTPEYPDWKLLSAEGAILDQLGRTDEARGFYQKALDLKPGEPSVLSNLGMSHLLAGDLSTAETYLRRAAEAPGADSRVRQNLALAVGLQGRFEEAEKIASQELSGEQAQANVAYLRSMLSQQNAWGQIKDDEKAKKATN